MNHVNGEIFHPEEGPRVASIAISRIDLMALLGTNGGVVLQSPVPKGAIPRWIGFSKETDDFLIAFEHSSFPTVRDGESEIIHLGKVTVQAAQVLFGTVVQQQ
jgi:hypothetical protein